MTYGRSDAEWDELTDAGLEFLIERARMRRTTSYTEMNVVLHQRTGLRPFDFDRADERAALGHLLYRITERDRPVTDMMISSLVQYLDANDAGPGFYAFAADLGALPRNASASEKFAFWVGQVKAAHNYYGSQSA
jgi:hypothetical protein